MHNGLCRPATLASIGLGNGPLTRYVKLRVTHALGMSGTFSRVSNPDVHHGTCMTHEPRCMPGSLTSGFLWSCWRVKRSRHSRRMPNPQFYVSGKRPMEWRQLNSKLKPALGCYQFYTKGKSAVRYMSKKNLFIGHSIRWLLLMCYPGVDKICDKEINSSLTSKIYITHISLSPAKTT